MESYVARGLDKSGFKVSSFTDRGNCVAVKITDRNVFLTHSRRPGLPEVFTHGEWDAFLKGVKAGEFDLV